MKDRNWACSPFAPIRQPERATAPYICRLAPYDKKFEMEWFDNGSDGAHTLYYRLRDSEDEYVTMPLSSHQVTVDGLQNEIDYEFYVARDDGSAQSEVRFINMTPVIPDSSVINYIHPDDQYYNFAGWWIGYSPIVRLPSGKLIVAQHVFGQEDPIVILFSSKDEGKTWQYVIEMVPFSQPRLFLHNDKLYITGSSVGVGGAAIAESSDEGKTWTEPTVLIRGMHNKSKFFDGNSAHFHSTPEVFHNGRIYFAFEVGTWGLWNDDAYECRMISAPLDSNLLDKNNWEYTPGCVFDHSDFDIPDADFLTAMEGNAMVGPDGEIYNMVRFDAVYGHVKKGVRKEEINLMLLYKLKNMDEPLEYVGPVSAKVGNRHGFHILKDDVTGYYFMVHNEETPATIGMRNILSLSVSKDMLHWEKKATLIDIRNAPFQSTVSQPAFIFDGDDLLYTSRTSWGKFYNQHNSNMATFHKLKNFRDLVK